MMLRKPLNSLRPEHLYRSETLGTTTLGLLAHYAQSMYDAISLRHAASISAFASSR